MRRDNLNGLKNMGGKKDDSGNEQENTRANENGTVRFRAHAMPGCRKGYNQYNLHANEHEIESNKKTDRARWVFTPEVDQQG